MKFLIVLFFLFTIICYADEGVQDKASSSTSILELILNKTQRKFMTTEEKRKLVEDVKYEFNLKDDDLAFIFSVRSARLPLDGFDFFEDSSKLLQLATLYLEAKQKWGNDKIISVDFYDFFRNYASDRTRTASPAIEKHFQLEEAKKRFKLPY